VGTGVGGGVVWTAATGLGVVIFARTT
jgi:hypothetical protein